MSKDLRIRFQDAPWLQDINEHYITVGGSGGIGSWLTLFLSRIGFENIELFDFDTIEPHNIGGQWFKTSDVGKFKVIATKENVLDFSKVEITAMNQKIEGHIPVGDIVFSAFDNMEARKTLFNLWKEQNKGNPNAIFIDGRLAAEQFEIYCVENTPESIAYYEDPKVLFPDGEVDDTPCSMKQTSHFASMIGSLMTTYLTNHLVNLSEGEVVRVVPKEVRYIGQLNMFNSVNE